MQVEYGGENDDEGIVTTLTTAVSATYSITVTRSGDIYVGGYSAIRVVTSSGKQQSLMQSLSLIDIFLPLLPQSASISNQCNNFSHRSHVSLHCVIVCGISRLSDYFGRKIISWICRWLGNRCIFCCCQWTRSGQLRHGICSRF